MGEQTISGDGAIGVQVEGDSNRVTILAGGARLLLEQWHKQDRSPPQSERELLLTNRRVTRLVGREEDLAALDTWRDGPAPVSVRCLIGRAGSGKTRLAIEACERAAAAGWTPGFVEGRELKRFHSAQNLGNWRTPVPTLIVVDEAAASARILKDWLDGLARRPARADEPHLRLLLLERHADPDHGWWAELKRVDSLSSAGAADLIGDEAPVELQPLSGAEDRRALLADAMASASALLGRPAPELPRPGEDGAFDRLLADDSRPENEPLFLIMAGLVAVETGAPEALGLSRPELGARVAEAEKARLARLGEAKGLDPEGRLIAHLAACLTIERGSDFEGAARLVDEELAALGAQPAIGRESLVEMLAEMLPGPVDGLGGIKPDLVGGAFLLAEIEGSRTRSETMREAIVERCFGRAGVRAVETLVLAAQDHAGRDPDHKSVRWLRSLVEKIEEPERLEQVALIMPERSEALRRLLLDMALRQLDLFDREAPAEGGEVSIADKDRRAVMLRRAAFMLSESGRLAEAVEKAEQGVRIEQELAEGDERLRERLAFSLNNLCVFLKELGRPDEAVIVARMAVEAQGKLCAEGAISTGLAGALGNLSGCLAQVGGAADEAIEAARSARAMWEMLDDSHPGQFEGDLATAENRVAVRCAGRFPEEALAAAERAEALFRRLAAKHPDSYAGHHAMSLETLANRLGDSERHGEALAIRERIASAWSRLPPVQLGQRAFHVAASHVNLAASYLAAGRWAEAAEAAERGIDRFGEIARSTPETAKPMLVRGLMNLAVAQDGLGNGVSALQSMHYALEELAPLFMARPAAHVDLMQNVLGDYIERARAAGVELNADSLMPLINLVNETRRSQQ